MKKASDIIEEFNIVDSIDRKSRYVTKEYQDYGYRLALKLNSPSNIPIFIKYAKIYPRSILESALSFTLDYPHARDLVSIYLWKVKLLREEYMKEYDKAMKLVKKYTKNKNLIKHMISVSSAMAHYAKVFNQDPDLWSAVGLIHDFDYEKMGKEHPSEWGYNILRENGYSEEVIDAIKGHALRDEPDSRKTKLAKTLFAVDELTGFIVAVALVLPEKLDGVTVERVIKKLKEPGFAKGVNREDVYNGAEELEVDLESHIEKVIEAMKDVRGLLEL